MDIDKETLIARMLVVAYLLGTKKTSADTIPKTVGDMMNQGHDGLNWEAFVPLARGILEELK